MRKKLQHLFVAGVPATGKSWLGCWLRDNHLYRHIDAEKDDGAHFDLIGIHSEWNEFLESGNPTPFVAALDNSMHPVIISWGFPMRYLYTAAALKHAGVGIWWLYSERQAARAAFVRRRDSDIDPACFDRQMDDIEREWFLVATVFRDRILLGLDANGSQRHPSELWSQICAKRL